MKSTKPKRNGILSPQEEIARRKAQSAKDKAKAMAEAMNFKGRDPRPSRPAPRPAARPRQNAGNSRPPGRGGELRALIPANVRWPNTRGGLDNYQGMSIHGTGVDAAGRKTWLFRDIITFQTPVGSNASYTFQNVPNKWPKIAAFSTVFGKVRLRGMCAAYVNSAGTGRTGWNHGLWDYDVNQADSTTPPSVASINKKQGQIAREADKDCLWRWGLADIADAKFIPVYNTATSAPPTSFHGDATEDRFYFVQELETAGTNAGVIYILGLLEFTEAQV